MASTPFAQKTSDFLAWFKGQPGTTFHHDIEIQDLRAKGAGRGIGELDPPSISSDGHEWADG